LLEVFTTMLGNVTLSMDEPVSRNINQSDSDR